MVSAGAAVPCTKTYKEVRGGMVEVSLRKLGVEKLSREDILKMQWEMLEGKIGCWIQFMHVTIKLLFASERQLCDAVYIGLDPHRERCFAELAEPGMTMLLSFGEAIVRSKRSPEKLFVLLDMYETMRDVLGEVDSVFSGDACLPMRDAAKGLLRRLSVTARETFGEFEEAVEKDATKTPVADGTVHPLTSYVINYVKFLFDYQNTLKLLFGEDAGEDGDQGSRLAVATARIMQVLQNNLDAKAKLYRDPALTQLFLMNNVHYIVRSVRRSEAKDLLGDDWVQRHRRVVQQHANQYQRAAWGRVRLRVLGYLSGQGLSSGGSGGMSSSGGDSGVNRTVLKERFKNFNLAFEELHRAQCQWTIPDTELREAVRLAVAEVLLPAYRSFLKRYSSYLESGKNPGKYIKYTPEDLERLLSELFEGKMRIEQKR
eukprot:SM000287S10628  [mRNA]  locus=s287:5699:8311:- [translate_table: standard]